MSSGGLGQSDIGGQPDIIGGFALEFYERNRARYANENYIENSAACRLPAQGCNATYNLEPHVAESIYNAMLQESGVLV
jgi:hypothetical protein